MTCSQNLSHETTGRGDTTIPRVASLFPLHTPSSPPPKTAIRRHPHRCHSHESSHPLHDGVKVRVFLQSRAVPSRKRRQPRRRAPPARPTLARSLPSPDSDLSLSSVVSGAPSRGPTPHFFFSSHVRCLRVARRFFLLPRIAFADLMAVPFHPGASAVPKDVTRAPRAPRRKNPMAATRRRGRGRRAAESERGSRVRAATAVRGRRREAGWEVPSVGTGPSRFDSTPLRVESRNLVQAIYLGGATTRR